MNLSEAKKLRRDICKTSGHESADKYGLCPRCKYRLFPRIERIILPTFSINDKPNVKWSEVNMRRYNILDRARERASNSIDSQENSDETK